jgi:diacylglycerol kinase (ATP)
MASPLLIFANSRSGGGLTSELPRLLQGDPSIHFVQLPDEAATWEQDHAELLTNPTLRCVSCGGDGTANWVTTLLTEHYGLADGERRPPLAMLPFGTGNDMSRSQGWGRRLMLRDLPGVRATLDWVRNSMSILNVDVWTIKMTRTDRSEVTSQHMVNYCSIGADAETAHDYEMCRQGSCSCCFCCACMSLACYVPVGFKNLCCKRSLRSYVTIEVEQVREDATVVATTLSPLGKDKTVIFQATPSMYAGTNPWTPNTPQAMNDQIFEVTMQGGLLSLGFFQLGCNTGRPNCQGTSATVRAREPSYIQIDGEGIFLNGPATIEVMRGGSYPMIFNRPT